MLQIMIIVYVLLNIIGYYIMKVDKEKARKNEYRISEKTLWLVAIFFGATGMTAGMRKFRHKTKHTQFRIGLPLLVLVETGVMLYFFNLLS